MKTYLVFHVSFLFDYKFIRKRARPILNIKSPGKKLWVWTIIARKTVVKAINDEMVKRGYKGKQTGSSRSRVYAYLNWDLGGMISILKLTVKVARRKMYRR